MLSADRQVPFAENVGEEQGGRDPEGHGREEGGGGGGGSCKGMVSMADGVLPGKHGLRPCKNEK